MCGKESTHRALLRHWPATVLEKPVLQAVQVVPSAHLRQFGSAHTHTPCAVREWPALQALQVPSLLHAAQFGLVHSMHRPRLFM